MSERYSRLFALSGQAYTPGAPVTLAAGALLKDNQTGKVLAQLKLRSISPKPIKAAKVQIIPMDTVGRPLGEPVEHAYLDLSVGRNADFGQKSAILLPDAECRRFSARVTEVAFGDNTVWSSDGEWKALPYARPLQEALPDVELYKQYRLTFGNQCRYLPSEHEDLWYCGCGALNRKEESTCHKCGLELARLKAVDWAALDAEKNARVAAEQAEAKRLAEEQAKADAARRAEEARRQEIAAAKAKKKKKIGAICAVLAVVVCAAAYVVTQIILPEQARKEAYAEAQELFDAGNYSSASEMFSELGDYKDSAEMYLESRYQSAMAAFDEKNATSYAYAQTIFEKLGNYKDSATMVYECQYQIALINLNDQNYKVAKEQFAALGNYKDCSELLAALPDIEVGTFRNTLAAAQVGDIITIGLYEQDNISSNGEEPIEWVILEKTESAALVITKYCLLHPNTTAKNSWGKDPSALARTRFHLNTTPHASILGELFSLSAEEVQQYFPNSSDRLAEPTAFSKPTNYASKYMSWAYLWKGHGHGIITTTGEITYNDQQKAESVRPAMWITFGN